MRQSSKEIPRSAINSVEDINCWALGILRLLWSLRPRNDNLSRWIAVALILVMPISGYAQMGHGMMRGGHMTGEDHMMGSQGMMGQRQMMDHGQMMNNMMGMTQDMTIMMRQVSEMISTMTSGGADVPMDRRHKVSDIIRDMAAELNRMSFMIDRGSATENEMTDIQNRVMELRKRMQEIK